MIKSYKETEPRLADSVYIDDTATVIGDVEIGKGSNVWPGAVIRGDGGPIRIGEKTSIQDNVVVHANVGSRATIGDECVIGHGAVIHSEEISNRVLIGINATILRGSKVKGESIIAANSLVREEMIVPKRSFYAGSPGEVKRKLTDEDVERIKLAAAHYTKLGKEYSNLPTPSPKK